MIENEVDRQNIAEYDDPVDEIVSLLHRLNDDYEMDGVVPLWYAKNFLYIK